MIRLPLDKDGETLRFLFGATQGGDFQTSGTLFLRFSKINSFYLDNFVKDLNFDKVQQQLVFFAEE